PPVQVKMNAPEIHSILATASFAGLAAATFEQVASSRQAWLPQGQVAAAAVDTSLPRRSSDTGGVGRIPARSPANWRVMSPTSATRNDTLRSSASVTALETLSWRMASPPKTAVVQRSPEPSAPEAR